MPKGGTHWTGYGVIVGATNTLDVPINLAYILTDIHLHTHSLIDIEEHMSKPGSRRQWIYRRRILQPNQHVDETAGVKNSSCHVISVGVASNRSKIVFYREASQTVTPADRVASPRPTTCCPKTRDFAPPEETQPEGVLYPVRWLQSSLLQSTFLLGMSILCYYVQLMKSAMNVPPDRDRIFELLRNTYPIW
ncbi:hypothetical protein NA56DRAFT_748989 [Hyaloscypha hepaticicola]|uniref:Uncharacterized protein n=1 Tax=Hyaloscypha hepaticicola TaxID=2082293 RepID=A0A2J6Q450_9HELO|nr:hypothetical protein NA56DRAFT_748989 [Hyaloscypha hepaticicola]